MVERHLPLSTGANQVKRVQRHASIEQMHSEAEPELASAQALNVGRALRALRVKRDLSIRALAEKSGLAVNTLSLIENDKTSPSVSTLQQLAVALDVPITAFFENGSPRSQVAYIKSNHRASVTFAHGTLEGLGAGLTERMIEPFVVTINSNANSGTQAIVHTGQEFVFCLEGRIVYTVQDRTYLLEAGDSLLFESYLPHRWQNVESIPAKMILTLCPTDSRDRSTQQHFLPELLSER